MPDLSQPNVDVWRRRWRRMYATNLAGLKTLADTIAAEAGEMVTITATTMEGGSGTGVVTGNKLEMLAAAEDIIAELDDTVPAEPGRGFYLQFSP